MEKMRTGVNLVIQAETGAGKTTIVPLALLDEGFINGKIIVVQPRRIVCINAARRLADNWGDKVGQSIGYRIRHESRTSSQTQIEVVTEGILLRMLHGNPSLEGIGCIFFDEFHERNLDSDLSLTLSIAAQRSRNAKLQLVVMSATLGDLGECLTRLMDDCPLVYSSGRSYPVEVFHKGSMGENTSGEALRNHELEHNVSALANECIEKHEGDILVFLPGEAEIMYTWALCNNYGLGDGVEPDNMPWQAREVLDQRAADPSKFVQVCPLYGSMSREKQDEALAPREGWRKIFLCTPIAESSLTVPGVKVVIDSGLRRIVYTDSKTGIAYMRTIPVSTASADQRKGRAGRVSAGVCYRLWSQAEHDGLRANDIPELQAEDLTRALLDLSVAGYTSEDAIKDLPWVDTPEETKIRDACVLMTRVKGIQPAEDEEEGWQLTPRGDELGSFPLHPRLGHMLMQASKVSQECLQDACDLAAMLPEKDMFMGGGRKEYGSDMEIRLRALRDKDNKIKLRKDIVSRVLRTSKQLMAAIPFEVVTDPRFDWVGDGAPVSVLLAWAFPELVATKAEPRSKKAKRESDRGVDHYYMHVGCQGKLYNRDPLGEYKYIAVSKIADDKIWFGAPASTSKFKKYGIDIENPLSHEIFARQQDV